jgi:hypothetical protein
VLRINDGLPGNGYGEFDVMDRSAEGLALNRLGSHFLGRLLA